jgi:cold shock protein
MAGTRVPLFDFIADRVSNHEAIAFRRLGALRRHSPGRPPKSARPTCRPPAQPRVVAAYSLLEDNMAKGTVKWFNTDKGYGFIAPDTGGQDVFVHISAVQQAGLHTLNEGQKVEFEVVMNRGKNSAGNLKAL